MSTDLKQGKLIGVLVQQIRIANEHLRTLMLTNYFVVFLVWLILYDSVNRTLLSIWTLLILCLISYRLIMQKRLKTRSHDIPYVLNARWLLITNAGLSGLLWGAVPAIALTANNVAELWSVNSLFLIMVAMALGTGSSYRPAYLAFAVPVVASVTMSVVAGVEHYGYMYGLIGIVCVVILVNVSQKVENTLQKSLEIRFENHELLEELSRQKQEAERANIAKSKFLAAASHDLRQPLHALSLYLDTMNATLTTDQQHALAKKIGIAVEALNDLFQRLLDISKLDAGIVEPCYGDCLVSELFKRLEVRFLPLAEAKQLQISFDYGDEAIFTDPLLFERVLDNLISNAIRYTQAGTVTISSKSIGRRVVIAVDDTGPGIPREEQKNIFNEFYQLHNPERDRTKGLGLGLSIVKRLCVLLEHELEMDSAPGQGTCFFLSVAAGNPQNVVGKSPAPATSAWDLTGARVFVIDDEAEVREAMRQLLQQWGCEVTCADSTDEALAAVRSGIRPDLIVADYRLRDMKTGVDAIRAIIDCIQSPIPAVLVTGDTAPERLQEAASSGFKLLYKPVSAGQLRMVINHLFAQHRRRSS